MRIARPADLDALAWGEGGLLPVVVQEVATGAVLMLAWADREAAARTLARGEGWFWSRSRRRLWRKGETSGNVLAVVEMAADCDGDALLYRVDTAGPVCHTGTRSCFEAGRAGDGGELERRLDERGDERAGVAGGGSPGVAGRARELGADAGEAGRLAGGWAADRDGERRAAADRPPGDPFGGTVSVGSVEAGAEERRGPRLELGWLWDVVAARAGADPAESYTARLLAAGVDRIARKVGEEATEVVIAALRARSALDVPGGLGGPSPLAAEAADLLYHLLVLLLAAGGSPDEVAAELRRRHARPVTPPSAKPEDAPTPADPAPKAAGRAAEDRR